MTSSSGRPPRVLVAAAVAATVVFALVLRLHLGTPFVRRAFDDLAQTSGAALGAFACSWRARRTAGRSRVSWGLLAGGLASWALGQALWSYYELIARREVPFPSPADLGYLLFPVLALAALLVRPSAVFFGRGRLRVVLDGAMVAASLFVLSWTTSLGEVYHSGAPSTFAFVVSLAYPVGDLVLLTVASLCLAHARHREGLALLLFGLGSMALADSGFTYLTALGRYETGSIVDIAWFAAFVMMALAATCTGTEVDEGGPEAQRVESVLFAGLPYVVLLLGGGASIVSLAHDRATVVTFVVEVFALLALLLRQWLTVLDNRRLALDVISQQDALRFQAFHDNLTGLANRALFSDRLEHALELHERDRRVLSVMFCDLDDFKAVNDTLGHDAGDVLLVAVAERLRAAMRASDTVARLGGDEFAVLIEDDAEVDQLSARLLSSFTRPVEVAGRLVPVRMSVGTVTVTAEDGSPNVQELLKNADLAMYAAKQAGKGTLVPYTPALSERVAENFDERLHLAADIHAGTVQTAFQPITYADGRPFAFEALARWSYQGVAVPPVRFIAIAERAGLLSALDLLMIRNALAAASAPTSAQSRLLVSVNLGLSHLHESDLPERLLELVAASGIPRENLIIEVPETEVLANPRTVAVLETLRSAGLSIALDDFGIGYSNLARLGALGPDFIKLDRSLVDPLDSGAATHRRLVAGMIDMAHDLGAVVIGEGVETQGQLDALRELGCDAVQGYLIGRPEIVVARTDDDTPHEKALLALG